MRRRSLAAIVFFVPFVNFVVPNLFSSFYLILDGPNKSGHDRSGSYLFFREFSCCWWSSFNQSFVVHFSQLILRFLHLLAVD